jgi:hypothetical protein
MSQGADPYSDDMDWARWDSDDSVADPSTAVAPDPQPPPRPVEPRWRRLIGYAALVVTVFVLAAGVGFWYVQTAPGREFEDASASFHAESGPLAEQLDRDIERMRAGESMSALHPTVVGAGETAQALQDAYAAYSERLGVIEFRGGARQESRRLRSAVNAGQLLMSVAMTSYDKDNMLQVLQAWPDIDATIEDAEHALRTAL